jgi:hypothetical protein
MLAKGAHGSSGASSGFALPTFASKLLSQVMIQGKNFIKTTSYPGFTGNILMFLYIALAISYPATKKVALILFMIILLIENDRAIIKY